ncbi:MAG: LysE family transporter [Desulfobacterales bacterium]|nr:MAG: LysE family transporter [Desulfobacterales bacterium]
MSSALWVGVMFGLSAGFAPGPLLTLVITQTLRHGIKEGILTASAPVLTDAPIILVSFVILNKLSGIDIVLGLITAIGGGYVFFLSYETIKTDPVKTTTTPIQPRSLRKGVLVNALNPHPYLFWATVGVPFILKIHGENPYAAWIFLKNHQKNFII